MGAGQLVYSLVPSAIISFQKFYIQKCTDFCLQEGWLAEHAVSEEDRLAADRAKSGVEDRPEDPMQGLEGLDVAGPKPE